MSVVTEDRPTVDEADYQHRIKSLDEALNMIVKSASENLWGTRAMIHQQTMLFRRCLWRALELGAADPAAVRERVRRLTAKAEDARGNL